MSTIRGLIARCIDTAEPGRVFVPQDFALLARRDTIDKALQRMVTSGELRRIGRGLYDRPTINALTKRPTAPDYRMVVDAIARRDQARLLVDGNTAANDLGLTNAVPSQVTIYSDTRRRSIQLDKLVIRFKITAPSRLYWAGRPAMRIVQALHWLKDMLPAESDRIRQQLTALLIDQTYGAAMRQDLYQGFGLLPIWMQDFLRTFPIIDPTVDT
ncbi:hypothetical protein GNZ10_22915 [Ralstonia sp. 3N]|nr:DUF6088 family protein [Ralstonia sp. UNCCL144]MBA9859211.1 hypothetical protein [Ralstonia insidiosa]NPT52538.1 hypothetical protein [Ralstonia sp. 3N]MBA9939292.1 hypothetical protein [Ralstonia insidiosa]MBC9968066.1 hypothetical protein [Ralstonia insidiosa]MBX3904371.1 hypothetical protein [Ralstonia insidiosa]